MRRMATEIIWSRIFSNRGRNGDYKGHTLADIQKARCTVRDREIGRQADMCDRVRYKDRNRDRQTD